jgi:hypothetical protein
MPINVHGLSERVLLAHLLDDVAPSGTPVSNRKVEGLKPALIGAEVFTP